MRMIILSGAILLGLLVSNEVEQVRTSQGIQHQTDALKMEVQKADL